MLALTLDAFDLLIEHMESACRQVDETQGSMVKQRLAQSNMLKHLGKARDFLTAVFKQRNTLLQIFGNDLTLMSRIRAVISDISMSEDIASDTRLEECQRACDNIELVLSQLGYTISPRCKEILADYNIRRRSIAKNSQRQAILSALTEQHLMNTPERDLVKEILACERPEDLAELQPNQEENLGWWLIWMVHRLHLNDPSLKVLNFTNLPMPSGDQEQQVSPKLVKAIANNNQIEQLIMPNSNLRGCEARVLEQSLAMNTSLKVLNIDSNAVRPDDLAAVIKGVGASNSIEEFRCNNQYLGDPGRSRCPALEALLEAVKMNTKLTRLGMTIVEPHFSNEVNRQLMRNKDRLRQERRENNPSVNISSGGESYQDPKEVVTLLCESSEPGCAVLSSDLMAAQLTAQQPEGEEQFESGDQDTVTCCAQKVTQLCPSGHEHVETTQEVTLCIAAA